MCKYLYCVLFLLLLLACNGTQKQESAKANAVNNKHLELLQSYSNSYPQVIGLFQNDWLNERIKNLMGDDYRFFQVYWNVETPIAIQNQVLICSGCKQHDCPTHHFYLVVDLKHDKLNVYYFATNRLIIYAQNNIISLPSPFKREIEVVKRNAGVIDNEIVYR